MPDISTIGSDPEFFITHQDGSDYGLPIASWEMTNHEGFEQFNLEPDNAAFEIHPEPVPYEDFVPHYRHIQNQFIKVFTTRFPRAIYSDQVVTLHKHHIQNPQADQIGCQPFKTIWDVEAGVTALKAEELKGQRTAGGHIWMGIEEADFIKCLDATIGLWQTKENLNRHRYKHYGKAGAYKQKPGLLEYRTLGNWWMFDNYMEDSFNTVKREMDRALELFNSDKHRILVEQKGADIQRAINTNDRTFAGVLYHEIYEFNRITITHPKTTLFVEKTVKRYTDESLHLEGFIARPVPQPTQPQVEEQFPELEEVTEDEDWLEEDDA